MTTEQDKREEISWWKQKAQELRVQLQLGITEAADKYEGQKKEIGTWAKQMAGNIGHEGSEAALKLKAKLEELQVQATLGKAETKDKLAQQRKNMQETMAEAKQAASTLAKEVDTKTRSFGAKAQEELDHWHTKLDLLKLRLHLGAKDAASEWEERKGELKEMVEKLDDKIDELSAETAESWDELKNDITSAWDKMKRKLS